MNHDTKKRGLGRGLGALIVNTTGEPAGEPAGAATGTLAGVRSLPVAALHPNPHQPRSNFDAVTLQELADSIRTHGIIQPLVVTAAHGQPGYWIIAGERRWRAAQQAGLAEVPVIVREASSQQLTEWALVENVQRDDLNAIEEAAAYHALMNDYGLTQAEVAERVGKSRPAVANTVRLLQLPLPIQQAVIDGVVSAGHARALLVLPDAEMQLAALQQIVSHELNVRQVEALVKRLLENPPASRAAAATTPDPQRETHWREMENRFRASLGTKVSLDHNKEGGGRLVIHFYSDDDLAAIYQLIAGEDEL